MSSFIEKLHKIKRIINQSHIYKGSYAFIGMGRHALANLYPVLMHLGVRLKYIVTQSESGKRSAKRKFPDTNCVTDISLVQNDADVQGCFVCTQPSAHYGIIRSLVSAGKHVFVEKPPCSGSVQLQELIDVSLLHKKKIVVGLQKQYAPSIEILRRELDQIDFFSLNYLTGFYPEGNPLTDLFIHPISLSVFLFGQPEILSLQKIGAKNRQTVLLHTKHKEGVIGSMELSTAMSWRQSNESLTIYTPKGWYDWNNCQKLTFSPASRTLFNIPFDKIRPFPAKEEILFQANSFVPTLYNNPVYYEGFYNEIKNFIHLCEGRNYCISTFIEDLKSIYTLFDQIDR